MEPLTGKTALVTGGSRGIGLAIAQAMLVEGMHVAITGRNPEHLSRAAGVLEGVVPESIETIRADMCRSEDVEAAVARTVERFGGLDVLVNNAGIGVFGTVADMTLEQWREVVDTNLTGVFYACHAAIPQFRRRGGGTIVNISSLAGSHPFANAAAYCASKAGLNAFSEALMQELRYEDIRVSCVMPGSVATDFSSGGSGKGGDWKTSPEDVAEVVLSVLRQNRRSLSSRIELRPSKPARNG
jgi:3-oxoacyl-[acyl-carrier protein] reductase